MGFSWHVLSSMEVIYSNTDFKIYLHFQLVSVLPSEKYIADFLTGEPKLQSDNI